MSSNLISKSNDNGKSFTRRAFVIGGLQIGLLGVLSGRLAWLQLAQGDKYRTLSDKNRIDLKILSPSRGKIYDRNGTILALNNKSFRVIVIPEQAEDVEKSLRSLQNHIDLDEDDIKLVLKEVKANPKFVPIEVKEDLSWEEVSTIEVNLPELPGLSIDVGEVRQYPYPEATAHIIGYVGAVNKSELTDDPVLKLPGFKIGKTGIEKALDEQMRGKAGTAQVEVNVVGREVRELKKQESQQGDQIVLTIDLEIQQFLQQELGKHKSASGVLMDVNTGEVFALASHPSFDPNLFTHGISAPEWEALLSNPGYPLNNKAVAGQYPPASTFKMVTALAGMETGHIKPNTRVYCPGFYEYGEDRFHCWKKGGHGSVDVVDALAESCDTYFYKVATDIGIDKIAEVARKLGLGQEYDFDLSEERAGLVPDKAWKMGRTGKRWHPGETIVSSIGQGSLLATPLQLAVMTARLVNGGYAVEPWMVGRVADQAKQKSSWPKIGFDQAFLDLIKLGTDNAVNVAGGTAFGSRIENEAIAMGGKTGTAQVKKITAEQRLSGIDMEEITWRHRHHGLFVGYAPYHNPRYACSIVVEHGIGGSVSAAPIAKQLMIKAMQVDPARKPIIQTIEQS